MSKILFLVPYPSGIAPSQRYRFEQYFKILESKGYQLKVAPFINSKTWNILYQDGYLIRKTIGLLTGLINRFLLLFSIRSYDWVFIHRECILLGFGLYEWLLASIFNKKIIFDFDDAIWLEATSPSNRFVAALKSPAKTARICKLSKRVSVGNSYLATYASKFTGQVSIIPTTIDTNCRHNIVKRHMHKKVVVGWTGSHSTLTYLSSLLSVLSKLGKSREFEFKVIADQNPGFNLDSFRFTEWKLSTEIEDLMEIDIGLMPLPNDQWTKGKCGLKALQYMSLGIPALVSPVGVNREIVTHGVEGFHCNDLEDWSHFISKLINDTDLRTKMGQKGREKVIKNYSVDAIAPDFLSLFK